MKKQLVILSSGILLSLLLFISCTSQNTIKPGEGGDTSQTSLDWDGIYRGTLPCADCSGIKTTVYLMKDQTFKMISEYVGKDVKHFETTGKFSWNEAGNTITLNSGSEKTQFFVGEDTLTRLDLSGNKITGDLASKYILTKGNYSILNKKWALTELMGKPVDASATMKKEAYIMFSDADNSYSASAGCNGMGGSFSTESHNKLVLGQGITTMMACPDMTLETEFSKILKIADSFQINGDELILLKGRMAPLARFKIPMN